MSGWRILFIGTLLSLLPPAVFAQDCVVLLHGLGRGADAMNKMEQALRDAGFATANVDYPSREKSVAELAELAVADGMARCRARHAEHIHFVTHSLGGILVRQYFQQRPVAEARRVVMLGPPNHGSEVVDKHREAGWFRKMTGKAGQELGTETTSVPNSLKPVPLAIGVIAGTRTSDPWFSGRIPGDDDGKVSTASAKLDGMKDYLEVAHGHTFMMRADDVIRQTIFFLRNERFDREAAPMATDRN